MASPTVSATAGAGRKVEQHARRRGPDDVQVRGFLKGDGAEPSRAAEHSISTAEGGSKRNRRVHLEVRIGGRILQALVDTGATLTALEEGTFREIQQQHPESIEERLETGLLQVTSAGSERMHTQGTYMMRLIIKNEREVRWPVTVIRNLSSEMILGDDILSTLQATISVSGKSVSFAPEQRDYTLRCREETKLPPFSRQSVNAVCTGKRNSPLGVVVPRNQMVLKGLQEWQEDRNTVRIVAVNATPEVITWKRGEELATWIPVRQEDTGTVEAFKACRPAARAKEALSEEKARLIREETQCSIQDRKFRTQLQEILVRNHEAISANRGDLGRTNAVPHRLITRGERQIYRKQFPIPEAHVPFVNRTIDELLRIGAVEPDLSSHHNTPIFCVKKPHSDDLRLVQDLRMVNDSVEDFFHPILDVQACIAKLGGMKARYFAALDLTSGFYQLELDPESRPLTAFTVPGRGRFSWTVSTMGLKTSPGAFSRLMEHVMQPVQKSVTYIDDVILAGETQEELLQTIEQALQQLKKFNLKLNLRKCTFGAEEVEYLGYRISRNGIAPGSEKTEALRNFPPPSNQQEVRRFIGMANYFRGHIPQFAQTARYLTKLTCKDSSWTAGPLPEEAKEAFDRLRQQLASAPVTALPRPNEPYTLETDASTEGLGACLTQVQDGVKRVIGYASKGLERHERNYTAFLLEHRAAVFGIEHFRHLLTGARFELVMDHKPLLPLSTTHKKTLSRLQQLMSEFSFHLRYRPGKENTVADALSRAPVEALADSHQQLEELQRGDELCRAVLTALETGLMPTGRSADELRIIKRCCEAAVISGGCVYIRRKERGSEERLLLLTPKRCQRDLLKAAHAHRFAGHGGEAKTLDRLRLRYCWPGMVKDVAEFVKNCRTCQESKSPPNMTHTRAPLQLLPPPDIPNARVHLDLFSVPRRSNNGNKNVLVITDAFSKWTELVPCPDKEARTIAEGFFNRWICRYSTPRVIVTDRGREFNNQLMQELAQRMDFTHRKTSAYHPQTNTSAESFNRTLIKILTATMPDPDGDWEALLPIVMLTYNTRVHASTKASPFFLTFLRDPNLPHFDLDEEPAGTGNSWAARTFEKMQDVFSTARQNIEGEQERGRSWYDAAGKQKTLRSFRVGEKVYVYFPPATFQNVKNKKFVRTWRLHEVTRIISPTTYMVKAEGRRQHSMVHVNRMKPCYAAPQEEAEDGHEEENEPTQQATEQGQPAAGREDDDPTGDGRAEIDLTPPVQPVPPIGVDLRSDDSSSESEEEEEEEVQQQQQPEEARPQTRSNVRNHPVNVRLTPPRRPIEYKTYTRRGQ